MGAGESMALDRARKRRKELEAEEAEDRAAETLESDVSEVQAQGSRTRKGQKMREEVPNPPQPSRPRPKPRPLKQPGTALKPTDNKDDSHRTDQQPITLSSDSEPASIAQGRKFAKSMSLDADLSPDIDSHRQHRRTQAQTPRLVRPSPQPRTF